VIFDQYLAASQKRCQIINVISMLDKCESFAVDYDIKFNCVKSVAMRIGPIYNCTCADLILCNKPLAYVSLVKCIGVYISAVHMIVSNWSSIERLMHCIVAVIVLILSWSVLNLLKLTACHCCYMPLNQLLQLNRLFVWWTDVLMWKVFKLSCFEDRVALELSGYLLKNNKQEVTERYSFNIQINTQQDLI